MELVAEPTASLEDTALSVARLTLLQAALDLLSGCPENCLEGNQLSTSLRQLHPKEVAEVSGQNAKQRKGWLRQLLAQEPLISQVQPPGRGDLCYTIGPVTELAAAPGNGEALGNKRPAAALLEGEPEAKRRPNSVVDLNVVAAKIPQAERMALVQAAGEILGSMEGDFMEGNRLSEALRAQMQEAVDVAKAACGGKGWLKALMDTTEGVQRVEVPGRAEPCYRLDDGTMPYPLASSWSPGNMRAPGAPPVAKAPPMARPGLRPSAVPYQGGPAFGGNAAAGSGAISHWTRQTLMGTATAALARAEKGYMEGNKLSDALRAAHPVIVPQAKSALGGMNGKGWLKKLFETEPSVEQIEVDVVKEPCYRLAGSPTFAAPRWPGPRPVTPRPQVRSPVPPQFSFLRAQQPAWAPGRMMAGPFGPGGPRAHGRRPVRSSTPASAPVEVSPEAAEAANQVLLQEAATILASKEWLEGNRLSDALRTVHPQEVETARTALGGKGWLKKLLEHEPRVVSVKVQGRHEPCFALAEKCDGITEFSVEAPPPSSGLPSKGAPTIDSVREKLTEEETEALMTAAVSALAEVGLLGGHLEGGKLAEKMRALEPQAVEKARQQLRKGWLRALLQMEPRIQTVEVGGKDEPCYQLLAS